MLLIVNHGKSIQEVPIIRENEQNQNATII